MHNIPHTEEAKSKMSESHKGIPLFHKRRKSKIINGIEYFICGRCKKYFPREGFYKEKRTILGLKSECKQCHMQTAIKSRNKENMRSINREYMRRAKERDPEKFRKRDRLVSKKQRNDPNYKHKIKCRQLLNDAVKKGNIIKPKKCEKCGKETNKLHGHHNDYSKPFDVEWLCTICHGKRSWKAS